MSTIAQALGIGLAAGFVTGWVASAKTAKARRRWARKISRKIRGQS
jgi:hypothetical protein